MPIDHREIAFEDAIEPHLLNVAGHAKDESTNCDREHAVDPALFIPFVKATQPNVWEDLETLHGSDTTKIATEDMRNLCHSGAGRNPVASDG